VGRQGLNLRGVRFLLLSAHDGMGRLLYDRRLAGMPVQVPGETRLGDDEEAALRNPKDRWLIDLILLFIPSTAPLETRVLLQAMTPSR
jgi:hypothetical protein